MTSWIVPALAVAVVVYALAVLVLVLLGRRGDARALAGFVPDCVVLVRRLLGDPRLARRHKVLLGLTVAYLVSPIDLVPDVIPVAGQLDDAIVLALALRGIVRAGGTGLLREHWRGPPRSLALILRLAGARGA